MIQHPSDVALKSGIQAMNQGIEPSRRDPIRTSRIGNLPVNRIGVNEAVELIMQQLRVNSTDRKPFSVLGVNAQIVNLAMESKRFASAMHSGDLLYADGISIVLASRILGCPLPERVPGGELMELLCREGAKDGMSVYLLGGLEGAAEKAAKVLEERYAGIRVAGVCCPPIGFEKDSGELARVRESIRVARPDFLFVCLGAPKQEFWVAENAPSLPVGVVVPLGAAFDTLAGLRKRAPVWARKTGMEWLYRLVKEPRRLWRRYLIGNPQFVLMTLRQLFAR